jgi:Domain of unknown function (DUF1835)
MIHLVAGESALMTLQETFIPGDKFSIDDILMEGPIIDGLRSESAWDERSEYLQRYFSIPREDYLSGKAERDRILDESLSHDEIVLWFEYDLFCQANLLYYLDSYASRDLGGTRLTLICPATFAGRPSFRGLGELAADELESLFPTRAEVSSDQRRVTQRAWQAFSNRDPRQIEDFLQSDSSPLPVVAPALQAHLERFPSTINGLGIVGQITLEILKDGALSFQKLFHRFNRNPEIFRYGMGDLQLQSYLDIWSSGPSPLIEENGEIQLTDAGRQVLMNQADALDLNGIDLWYGGVHLTPDSLWRWDPTERKLTSNP